MAFSYGGDLWTAPAAGGTATRLTAHPGLELFAKFSPDGKWIAFTGQYDGDEQVYVIPAAGGVPRQLTFYPARGPLAPRWGYDNQVYGWTNDGKQILFRSLRDGWVTAPAACTPCASTAGAGALPMPPPAPARSPRPASGCATRRSSATSAPVPAVDSAKLRIARETGEAILPLVKKGITPRRIITKKSLLNAIRVDMALGGSTNTVLHLMALAMEAEIPLSLDDFSSLAKKIPHICYMQPSGPHSMQTLYRAGGIPAVLKRLEKYLDDGPTVSGKKILQIAKTAQYPE